MSTLTKGIVVAVVHLLIVLSLGGKLLYDRANRPRVWVRTASVDPDLPIRGRYLTLSLVVRAPEMAKPVGPGLVGYGTETVELVVENGELVAHKSQNSSDLYIQPWRTVVTDVPNDRFLLAPSIAFFLPEHADLPRITPGAELWAEVTVPRKGPPRPIQLAMKRGTEWTPLSYR
jgi:hypothetical protein